MQNTYVLVDYENVQAKTLSLPVDDDSFSVYIFLGPNNTRLSVSLVIAMQELGNRGRYITLETSGTNALDFHIAYYLGIYATQDPAGTYYIISKDTGFDPLIKHIKLKNINCHRISSIEDLPKFKHGSNSDKNALQRENEKRKEKITKTQTQSKSVAQVPEEEKSSMPIKTNISNDVYLGRKVCYNCGNVEFERFEFCQKCGTQHWWKIQAKTKLKSTAQPIHSIRTTFGGAS